MAEYRHIFLDSTSNQRLSNNVIVSGGGASGESGAVITTGADIATGATNQLKQELTKTFINQPLNQATGGLWNPARQTVKAIRSGAGAAVLAAAGVGLAYKAAELGINYLIQKHEERIAKLENEAKESNNADNLLIKAGRLNIGNSTISYDRYGRAIYKYDKS